MTYEECEEDGDELSLLRLAWCSLALGCLDEPLLTVIKIASGESLMKQLSLSSSLELQICVCVVYEIWLCNETGWVSDLLNVLIILCISILKLALVYSTEWQHIHIFEFHTQYTMCLQHPAVQVQLFNEICCTSPGMFVATTTTIQEKSGKCCNQCHPYSIQVTLWSTTFATACLAWWLGFCWFSILDA